MNRASLLCLIGLLASFVEGCSEDERSPVGPKNPASAYCVGIGYQLANETCAFPDGTSCEQWSFYRGACGQPHSYCNLHGGTIESVTVDMGSFTTVSAVCTVAGVQCQEETFWRTGHCP